MVHTQTEMANLPPAFQTAQYKNEPVLLKEDGELYYFVPKEITTHRDAWKASLSVLFKHVADFHMLITNIIAETYNLDVNEMVAIIQANPKYKDLMTAPEVHALGYFSKDDLERHIPVAATAVEEPPVKPVKRVIRKKKTVVEAPPVESKAEGGVEPEVTKPEAKQPKPKAPRKKKQTTTPDGNSQT